MIPYSQMTEEQLNQLYTGLEHEYQQIRAKNLNLMMTRGVPCQEQLELSMPLLRVLPDYEKYVATEGVDVRTYGLLDGITECKELYAQMLGVAPGEVFIGGNSSLNLMHDTVMRGMMFGFADSERPWKDEEGVKCLCPVPGYDRHFAITELFNVEMIPVPMTPDGPDMDLVERLVAEDSQIKFIWCVPMYSNPQGITYSDETVRRFAKMKTAASDFKIIWDNAYCVHHLTDKPDHLLNLMDECKAKGTEDRVLIFSSMSKITFPGSAISAVAASENNMNYLKKLISVQTIGFDKMKQLRHAKYFKNVEAVHAHMQKHRAILEPKFKLVGEILHRELDGTGTASWTEPNGGYFVSVDTNPGCAKRVVELCGEAGVVLTSAGATYPYGKDPEDKNIRIAPTYPSLDDLREAMSLFCLCVKLASLEKLQDNR